MKIKYMVIDVDGVMTDAGIYYDVHGNELKKFSTRDAAGFLIYNLWQKLSAQCQRLTVRIFTLC